MKPEKIARIRHEILHPAHPRLELRKGEEIDSVRLITREYGVDRLTHEVVFEVGIAVPKAKPIDPDED